MSYPAKWLVFITVSVVFQRPFPGKRFFFLKTNYGNGYSTFFYQLWILYPIIPDAFHFFGNLSLRPIRSIRWASQIHTTPLLFGYLVLNVENGGNDPSFLWLVVWNMVFMTFHILIGMSSCQLTNSYFSER